jgi:hypothetical protein
MVTPEAFDPHPDRTRWLRRSAASALATAVLGVTGTGLAVAVLTARQPDNSGGTQATTGTDDGTSGSSGSSDSGSSSSDNGSSDNGSSGLGSAQQDSPTQGGSHGS